MSPDEPPITEQLKEWSDGRSPDSDAALLDLVYAELHKQAHRYLQHERIGHTLQTTALVHEAYLKLSKQRSVVWQSRSHFFAIAATLMRRILIDYAKSRHRVRRGGVQSDVRLDTAFELAAGESKLDLIELDEALDRLAQKDPDLARIVELRFFAGLEVEETADAMGVSESTVKRGWAMAKAWLHRELTK
ncbi:MAG TPA: sigma-70 family RNA polymerase sigma factor [Pyrinomonadaceae bacterium]|nr:sigma-70 family RNA polymerase sigma factor [Pyrinomonadaceae bacterium]